MITRYTTPYHTFVLPFLKDQVEALYITYSQNGEIVFEKKYPEDGEIKTMKFINVDDFLENASMGDEYAKAIKRIGDEHSSLLIVHLSQEDTSKFKRYPAEEKNLARIQLRVKDSNGEAFTSHTIRDRIFGSKKEGCI